MASMNGLFKNRLSIEREFVIPSGVALDEVIYTAPSNSVAFVFAKTGSTVSVVNYDSTRSTLSSGGFFLKPSESLRAVVSANPSSQTVFVKVELFEQDMRNL